MLIGILTAIFAGVFLGIITGLTPGLHTNTIAILLLGLSDYFYVNLNLSPLLISIMMIAMTTSHLFFDFLPSIFLGVPDEETALTVLPSHKLLLRGKGLSAFLRSISSALLSINIGFLGLPVVIFLMLFLFKVSNHIIVLILLFMSIMVIINHKNKNKRFWAFIIFLISGVLGLITLNLPFLKEPLLPMFSGLFGSSLIIRSLLSNSELPEQEMTDTININSKNTLLGFLAGFLTALFPAVSSSQAASVFKNRRDEDFIEKIAGVNASNLFLTVVAAFTISKFRSGVLVVMSRIISINYKTGLLLIISILISAGISVLLILKISKIFLLIIRKVNYKLLNILILIIIMLINLIFSNIPGLFILTIATFIGILSQELGVRKVSCMGSLILPVLVYYIR